jgi:hypothetical protein
MPVLKKFVEKKFEQSYELFARDIITQIINIFTMNNQTTEALNSKLIYIYSSILKSDKITFTFFKEIYDLIEDIYITSTPLETIPLQDIESFKKYFWNNDFNEDDNDINKKKYLKQLIHNIDFLDYFYDRGTFNIGYNNLFSYILENSKVAFQFIMNQNRIVNFHSNIITKIFENQYTTYEMKLILINEYPDKINFNNIDFKYLNLDIIKHPNFPDNLKNGSLFANQKYVTERFILENFSWHWELNINRLFNNHNISWQFLKEHFLEQIKTELPNFFKICNSTLESGYYGNPHILFIYIDIGRLKLIQDNQVIELPIRNDIPQIEMDELNINPLWLDSYQHTDYDSKDKHKFESKYSYWENVTFEEILKKVELSLHIENCYCYYENDEGCGISHDEGEYPVDKEIFLYCKFTAEQFIELIPLVHHTYYFVSSSSTMEEIAQKMITFNIDALHKNCYINSDDLIKIIQHFPNYICLDYYNFCTYLLRNDLCFENYFENSSNITSEYIKFILSRLLDTKPQTIENFKSYYFMIMKFLKIILLYGFNYNIFLKNNAKKEIAAFRIQNRYKNAMVNPYTKLGIQKINRDYNFFVNGLS